VEAGPELGRIKRALLEAQIRGEVKTREEAQAFVRSLRQRDVDVSGRRVDGDR
jgi:hypothetical protein